MMPINSNIQQIIQSRNLNLLIQYVYLLNLKISRDK